MNIDGELKGSLTAAASGYFQWQVLWFDGRFGEFKISEWKLGEAGIKVKGWADLAGRLGHQAHPGLLAAAAAQGGVADGAPRAAAGPAGHRPPARHQAARGRDRRAGLHRRGARGDRVRRDGRARDGRRRAAAAPPAAAPPAAQPDVRAGRPSPARRRRRPPARPPDGQPPSDPNKLPTTPAEAGLPDVEGGGGVTAVPAGPTEPGGA